jgi:hypothetical protein
MLHIQRVVQMARVAVGHVMLDGSGKWLTSPQYGGSDPRSSFTLE